jgi:hypothetical protein
MCQPYPCSYPTSWALNSASFEQKRPYFIAQRLFWAANFDAKLLKELD